MSWANLCYVSFSVWCLNQLTSTVEGVSKAKEVYINPAYKRQSGAAKISIDRIDHIDHCIARINLSPEFKRYIND